MSQENVEVVRAVYVAFSALAEGGDITRYVKTFDACISSTTQWRKRKR